MDIQCIPAFLVFIDTRFGSDPGHVDFPFRQIKADLLCIILPDLIVGGVGCPGLLICEENILHIPEFALHPCRFGGYRRFVRLVVGWNIQREISVDKVDAAAVGRFDLVQDRKSTRLLQSHSDIVCRLLREKKNKNAQ